MWRNGASLGLNDLGVLILVKKGPMSLLLPPPKTSES